MAIGNLGGGASASATTSYVGYRGCANTFTVPTGGNTDKSGNKPVLITSVRAYVAGRTNSAEVRFEISSFVTSYFTASADTSANLTGYKTINAYYSNGGTQTFRIKNSATDDYFYYGKGGSGTIYAINSSNANVLTLTTSDGLAGDFNYFYVPTAPGTPTVTQPNPAAASLSVSWAAPSSDGGSAITGYRVEYSLSNTFTSASYVDVTGTTATITGLTGGNTYYVRVAAKNAVTAAGSTWSSYSTASSATVLVESFDYDGWTTYGTFTNATRTLRRIGITAIPSAGLALTITTTGTGAGSVTTGTSGIQRTLTGLTVGAQYTISATAVLNNASSIGNIYALAVSGIGAGSSTTLVGTTSGTNMSSYTFTATSTSHVIRIQLQESVTYSGGSVVESVSFYNFKVTRVGVSAPYEVQDTVYSSSLANHFDLATRSVGASWWVDRNNITQFIYDFSSNASIATFSDTVGSGKLNYNDIKIGLQTKSLVNELSLNNLGIRQDQYQPTEYASLETLQTYYDPTLQTTWGPRATSLETNIYTSTVLRNLMTNPNCQYGNSHYYPVNSGATSAVKIVKLTDISTGATGFLSAGTTQPATGIGDYVIMQKMSANTGAVIFVTGDGAEDNGFPVTQGQAYTMSCWVRAGVNNAASLNFQHGFTYYNAKGDAVGGNQYQSTTTGLTSTSWTRMTYTVTVPSGTGITNMRLLPRFNYSGTNNTGFAYFITGMQLETGSTASAFFSGDTPDTTTYLYEWEGEPGNSISRQMLNPLDNRAAEIFTEFGTPTTAVSEITWNAQNNLSVAHTLDIGSRINIEFNGTTGSYRIVGINHDIEPERWLMNIKVEKV